MYEIETDVFGINIYSQVFVDVDELGDVVKLFMPLPDLTGPSEEDKNKVDKIKEIYK